MTLNRRTILQGLCAGLIFRPAPGFAQAKLPALVQFATGNQRLNPLAAVSGGIGFSGDQTVGLWAEASSALAWSKPHGFDTPTEFRPRSAGGMLLTGGRKWLAAHDLATGAEVWRHVARIQTGVPYVTESHVVFGDGHVVTALDTRTGALQWQFAAVPDTLVSYAPTGTADTVFVGPGDGHLYALGLADGRLRWSLNVQDQWQYLRQIQVEGDVLVAGTYKELLIGVSLLDGKKLWQFNAGNFINSQHVAQGVAYLWSPTGWLYAISTRSGQVLWRHLTTDYDDSEGNWASVLAEVQSREGALYILDLGNVIHSVDTATGTSHRSAALPGKVRHAVLPLADGRLAFPTEAGEILLTAVP